MREVLAERLKHERQARGKTQEEVAHILGISRANYGYYENGKNLPPIDKILSLAHFYNVSVDYLIGNEKKAKKTKYRGSIKTNRCCSGGKVKCY